MHWKNALLLLLFSCFTLSLSAQIKTKRALAAPTDVFRPATSKAAKLAVSKEIGEFGLLETDTETYAQLLASAPEEWTLQLPPTELNPSGFTLRLRQNDFLRYDFQLRRASNGASVKNPDLGKHYVGEIIGEPGSRVALSLLETEMSAILDRTQGERLSLGRVASESKSAATSTYLLFPDHQLLSRQEMDCATPDSGVPYTAKELEGISNSKSAGGCVDIYFEVDYDIYLDKGGVNAAAQHLAANFNEVSILYDAIDVDLKISEILVWDRTSPYAGSSSSALLTQFQSNRTSFNGDLAQLISYQASGGIAVLNGLCHPFNAARMSFSSIRPNFASVPTYSWSTMVIAHELGHLLGSQHTHACVWNGDNTAIDGCPGWTEGNCATPALPVGGGTIMSYCHLRPVGINFLRGFGPQPTAVIQNKVAAAQGCVQAVCSTDGGGGGNGGGGNGGGGNGGGGDGGGGDPPADPGCEEQTVYVNITLDDFGMETTWRLRSEGGGVVADGGPYPKKKKGQVYRDTVCVPDGCYVFEIRDSDFDGICCTYGNGSYELRDSSGTVLGSGSSFDTLDVVDFCLPEIPDGGGDDDCEAMNFISNPILTYGTNQDAGTVTVLEDGNSIFLERNAWKKVDLAYTITPDTWVSFWFKSTRQGEVHGLGFDDNDVISSNLTFRLYGTQNWGRPEFDNYPGNGEWKYYEINVGRYYVGQATNFFFTADHDVGRRDGNSYFRSVIISEGAPCRPAELPATQPLIEQQPKLELHPNPVSDQLRIKLPTAQTGAIYRIMDLSGRLVQAGKAEGEKLTLSVNDLPVGTYVFRYEDGERGESRKFTVAR